MLVRKTTTSHCFARRKQTIFGGKNDLKLFIVTQEGRLEYTLILITRYSDTMIQSI